MGGVRRKDTTRQDQGNDILREANALRYLDERSLGKARSNVYVRCSVTQATHMNPA